MLRFPYLLIYKHYNYLSISLSLLYIYHSINLSLNCVCVILIYRYIYQYINIYKYTLLSTYASIICNPSISLSIYICIAAPTLSRAAVTKTEISAQCTVSGPPWSPAVPWSRAARTSLTARTFGPRRNMPTVVGPAAASWTNILCNQSVNQSIRRSVSQSVSQKVNQFVL